MPKFNQLVPSQNIMGMKEALDLIEKMQKDVEGDYEQGVDCSNEKLEVLYEIKTALESQKNDTNR